jgi:O-antigen ligase
MHSRRVVKNAARSTDAELVNSASSPNNAVTARAALYVLTCVAVTVPFCIAYQIAPQPAFVSQLIAVGLWGAVLVVLACLPAVNHSLRAAEKVTLSIWIVLLAGVAFSVLSGRTPGFIAAPSAVVLLLALLIAVFSRRVPAAWRAGWFTALCAGIVLAAVYNGGVAMLQTWAPQWHDDVFIASSDGRRAWGNLRQPNLLASLTLWGLLAGVALFRQQRALLWLTCVATLVVLWLSASRTGWFGLLVAAVAAMAAILATMPHTQMAAQRMRHRIGYGVLITAIIAIVVAAMAALMLTDHTRTGPFDSMLQRLSLWRDVIALIKTAPWSGVGFAQLNFAWTLTPFAQRAPDVFDHAHALPLQLAVEFGLPLATLILGLLAVALINGFVNRDAGRDSAMRYLQLGMLGVILTHSMVEYPLWFAYFLLPSALLLSMLSMRSATSTTSQSRETDTATQRTNSSINITKRRFNFFIATTLALIIVAGIVWAWRGYQNVTKIYQSANEPVRAMSLAQTARRHWLYGYYGDYAAIILAGNDAAPELFVRPTRATLDENLLVAWARSLARTGDNAKAEYISARARELPWHPQFEKLPARQIAPANAASAPLSSADFRR